MMRILITGASGFIGSFLVKALKNKHKVRVLIRDKLGEIEGTKGIEIAKGNLTDTESLEKATKNIDIVIHCAALHKKVNYKHLHNANVTGTENLLRACEKNRIKKFIYLSSITTFGSIEKANEKSGRNPESDYAKTKLLGEKIAERYMKKTFPVTILIPSLVYGPSKRAGSSQWFRYIKKGYFRIFGKGGNKIEVIHISDLVRAIILTLNNKKSNNNTYIISGQTTTLNEFTNKIAEAENVRKPRHIPEWLAYATGFFLGIISKIAGKDMPLTITKIRNMTRSRSANISKAKKELGFKPQVSLDEGIKSNVRLLSLE